MKERSKPRIQPGVFILFVLIGLLPIAGGSLILIDGAHETQQELVGEHLTEYAEFVQSKLGNYFQRFTFQIENLANAAQVQDVVRRSNSQILGMEGWETKIQAIEADWPHLEQAKSALLHDLLINPASQFLRDYNRVSASFDEILVTDAYGRLVAATNKTENYLHGGQRWWRFAYREGMGGKYLGDISPDKSARLYAMEIAEPILDPVTKSAIGVIKAVIDTREIFGLINSVRVGQTGHAVLVRGDGTVITSPHITIAQQLPYTHFEQVRLAAGTNRPVVEAGEKADRVYIGMPRTKLKDTYPELDWYVAVQQPRDEAFLPFNRFTIRFLYIILFTVVTVLMLSLVFTWIMGKPVIETDPHLERL
jgi:hypothetical protein